MKHWERWLVYTLLGISLLFSLIVLSKCFPRLIEIPNNTGFDYIGFIIGILSFLVAILAIMFGYNILDIRRRIKEEIANEIAVFKSDIEKMQKEILFLKSKVVMKKIYVKGNIIIKTGKFQYRDLVAYADKAHCLNAKIIEGNLIIDDNYEFDPNTIYYASGDIISELEGEDEDIRMTDK